MFFTYIYRELRRRHRQALLTALGLAVGVGLVVAVTAYAGGVSNAQDAGPALAVRRRYRHHGVADRPSSAQGGPQRFGMQPRQQDAAGQGLHA